MSACAPEPPSWSLCSASSRSQAAPPTRGRRLRRAATWSSGPSFAQGFAHGYWVVAQGTMLSEEHAAVIANRALENASVVLF